MNAWLGALGIHPRPYRALVWALWTMDLRGQHFAKATGVQPKMLMSPLFWVVGQCLTMSCIAALVLFARVDLRFYVFANLSMSVLLLATMVLVEFHEVVFDPNDRDTIRHRPIPLRTYAAARFTNLLGYVGLMGFALTVFPAIVGAGMPEAGWLYLPAYLAASFGASMVAVAAVVWTLSLGGGLGQLKDLLAWSQILGILVLGYGAQFIFRDDSHAFFVWAAFPPAWRANVPTEWLAAFVEQAAVAPDATVLAQGAGLVALGAFAGASVVFRLRTIYGDARAPEAQGQIALAPHRVGNARPALVSPLLASAAERAGFWMAVRQLSRDGQLKVRVLLPLNTPIAVLVLGLATDQFEPPALAGASVLPLVAVYGVVLSLAPVLYQLRITETPEASWLLRTAPIARPVDLTLGAGKAMWFIVVGPIALGLAAVLAWQWGDPVSAVLHGLFAWSLAWPFALAGLFLLPPGLPFSQTEARGGSIGPLALPMAALTSLAGLLGAAHAANGGTPVFLGACVAGSVVASLALRRALG
ncbi:MAG: hypothetical protein R3F61_15380 [Myxococcota bacterium]